MFTILIPLIVSSKLIVTSFNKTVWVKSLDTIELRCEVKLKATDLEDGQFFTSWSYSPSLKIHRLIDGDDVIEWDSRRITFDIGQLFDGDTVTLKFSYMTAPLPKNIHSTYVFLPFKKIRWAKHQKITVLLDDDLNFINWPLNTSPSNNTLEIDENALKSRAMVVVSLRRKSWLYRYRVKVTLKSFSNSLFLMSAMLPAPDLRQSVDSTEIEIVPDGKVILNRGRLTARWSNISDSAIIETDVFLRTSIGFADSIPPTRKDIASGKFVKWNSSLRKYVLQVVGDAKDPYQRARILTDYVHNYLTYTENREKASSFAILKRGYGNCEDYAILLTAMLRSIGIPARIANGAAEGQQSNLFDSHAWVEAYLDGHWMSFDPAWGLTSGYIPLSHIKFFHTRDSRTPSLRVRSTKRTRTYQEWSIRPFDLDENKQRDGENHS